MHIGPDHLIVAAQVGFDDNISADRAEDVADGIDHRLTDRLPLVPHVFLDPTQTSSGSRPGPPPDQAHPERSRRFNALRPDPATATGGSGGT